MLFSVSMGKTGLTHDIFFEFSLRPFEVVEVEWKSASKGPGAKNDTSENPGSFNQILSFESQKWSPVATF